MMSAAKPIELISVEDYLAVEESARNKHEYSGGRIYMMAGASNRHDAVASTLLGALYSRLRGERCQPFNSDTKVRLRLGAEMRVYYPDAMVVCDPNPPAESFQDRPVVLAEVISPATRRIDEGEKLKAYLTIASLRSYLLIETASARVVAYERTADGIFAPRVYEGLEAVVPLEGAGIELPLAELYERIDFSAIDPDREPEDNDD